MKYELEATNENIMKTLQDDSLGRNKNIFSILKLLYLMKDNYNLCINGEWGTGKTFFVKQVIKSIELLNEEYTSNSNINQYTEKLKNKFSEIETKNVLFPIYYNAWEEDSNTDPLITVLYAIIENANLDWNTESKFKHIKESLINIIKGIEVKFGYNDQTTGKGIEVAVGYNNKNNKTDIFENIKKARNLKENVKKMIDGLLIEKGVSKLVIFIDELDRCKPVFAIELLERIKNYLNDDNIVFIFSIDILQLQYTVKKVYGEGFDGIYYLEKFFDMQMNLPKVPLEKYLVYKGALTKDWVLDKVSIEEFENLGFNLRDCNRYFKLIDLVRDYAENQGPFDEPNTHVLINCVILPILLMIKLKKANIYYKIINGSGKLEFIEELEKNSIARYEIESCFMTEEEKKNDMLKDVIGEIYESLFIKPREDYLKIGYTKSKNRFGIESQQKYKMNEILTFMNEYLNFNN